MLNYSPQCIRKLSAHAVPTLHVNNDEALIHTDTYDPLMETSTEQAVLPSTSTAEIDVDVLLEKIVELSREKEAMGREIRSLKKTARFYKDQCHILGTTLVEASKGNDRQVKLKATKILKKIFTPGQIRMLLNPSTRKIQWSAEDIASAIALRCISPKAYKYLRFVRKVPLPSISTLKRWARTLKFEPGPLHEVIHIMGLKMKTLSASEKLVCLSFDDIYISHRIEIDRKQEKVVGPHRACLCVMVRGLLSKWKQPFYYNFDVSMSKEIFDDIVMKLHTAGYTVVTVTCDLGPNNDKFLSEVGVGIKYDMETAFPNPVDSSKSIFYMPDVPHLLKLLRNHFLDSTFHYDQTDISSKCIKSIMKLQEGADLKTALKLKPLHIHCQGTERQKVKLAAQLFSTTVAKTISHCAGMNASGFENWEKTEYIVQLINDWFDIFNSRTKFSKTDFQNAFGVLASFEKQVNKIKEMSKFMTEMRIGSHKNLLKCQKRVLMANNSLLN